MNPKDLNEFLEPAVDELKALWKGVRLKSSLSRFALVFRAAVMCVSSGRSCNSKDLWI